MRLAGHPGGWLDTGLAYSPLWRARAGRATLATARDDLGLLVVYAPAAPALSIELRHEPGWAEWTGLAVTLVSAAGLAAAGWRRHSPGGSRRLTARRA